MQHAFLWWDAINHWLYKSHNNQPNTSWATVAGSQKVARTDDQLDLLDANAREMKERDTKSRNIVIFGIN